jgi:hypothetical protein
MTRPPDPAPFLALSLLLSGAAFAAGPEAPARPEPESPATRALVDFVGRAAAHWESRGPAACDDFKQDGGEWLAGDDYVFVVGFDGVTICHAARPALEGRNPEEIRDPDGKPVLQLFVRQLAGGAEDGWVHYLWPKRGESLLRWKSAYLRRAKSGDGPEVIVGSGAYELPLEKLFVVDRVDEAVELLARDGRAAFPTLRDKAGGFLFFDAYVFVMSWDGVMLVHPVLPELEGRPVLEIRDRDGVFPGQAILAALADREAAWVSYLWPRPGDEKPSRKDTYVRRLDAFGERWVVAAGVYAP